MTKNTLVHPHDDRRWHDGHLIEPVPEKAASLVV
jgi:hypothetical protein